MNETLKRLTSKPRLKKVVVPTLYWKKVLAEGQAPQVAHPGSDLGYDLFAAEDALLLPGRVTKVRTGIAVEFYPPRGIEFGDRSSMASKGVTHSGGKIDAGYRGELIVLLTLGMNAPPSTESYYVGGYRIRAGDKIIQMLPRIPDTNHVIQEMKELSDTARGAKGFGSSGK
jgi:dUTP pyrophosphatase